MQVTEQSDSNKIKLVTASGAALPILQQVEARVSFDGLESPVSHSFLVVKSLISPVIVGVDFLQQQHLSLDHWIFLIALFEYIIVVRKQHHIIQVWNRRSIPQLQLQFPLKMQSQKVMRIFKSSNVPFRSSRKQMTSHCLKWKIKHYGSFLRNTRIFFEILQGLLLSHIISFQPLDHLSGYHLAVFQQSIDRKWTSSSRIC